MRISIVTVGNTVCARLYEVSLTAKIIDIVYGVEVERLITSQILLCI